MGARFEVVEIDGFFELLDYRQHRRTGFHVVVGVFEDALDRLMLRAQTAVYLFERRQQLVVDEGDQLAIRHLG
jgi:hypothetical protein